MTADEPIEVIITAPERDWLEDLCHQLVDTRLAASAHVMHPVTSMYRWKGTVESATEARAFLRSRQALLDELVTYVVQRHPYEVPNVTAVPIVGGNPDYLAWLVDSTTERDDAARVTLHEELVAILREQGTAMSTRELAAAVNRRGRYRKRDGTLVTDFQIHGRTKNYPKLFERDGSTVRLRSG